MKYIVGVLPLFDEHKQSIWMLPEYLEMLERHQLVPFIFPYTTNKDVLRRLLTQVDGLLFTGGHDIHPHLYGQQKSAECGHTLDVRDTMESFLFQQGVSKDIPMLGICRGLQLFNVLQGGTLYQDLPSQYKSSIVHKQQSPYDQPTHRITFPENGFLSSLIGEQDYMVNSLHHQGIDQLAPGMDVLATSEDGLIEAIQIKKLSFAVAVQWHPEYMRVDDPLTTYLMLSFFNSCIDYSYVKDK